MTARKPLAHRAFRVGSQKGSPSVWPRTCTHTTWRIASLYTIRKRYSGFLEATALLQGTRTRSLVSREHWLDFSPYSPVPVDNNLCPTACSDLEGGAPPHSETAAQPMASVKADSRSERMRIVCVCVCRNAPLRVCSCAPGHRVHTNLNGSEHVSVRESAQTCACKRAPGCASVHLLLSLGLNSCAHACMPHREPVSMPPWVPACEAGLCECLFPQTHGLLLLGCKTTFPSTPYK